MKIAKGLVTDQAYRVRTDPHNKNYWLAIPVKYVPRRNKWVAGKGSFYIPMPKNLLTEPEIVEE